MMGGWLICVRIMMRWAVSCGGLMDLLLRRLRVSDG